MRMMIAGAALLATMAGAAVAESTVLATNGAWTTTFNVSSTGKVYCASRTESYGNQFSIAVDKGNEYTIFLTLSGVITEANTVVLDLSIDDEAWTFSGTDLRQLHGAAFAIFNFKRANHYLFLDDVMRGKFLRVPLNHVDDVIFSLYGSRNAMVALDDCQRRL